MSRRHGFTEITARVKERYIDEFLRFAEETIGSHELTAIDERLVRRFAHRVYMKSSKRDTARAKLAAVFAWVRWLASNGELCSDPVAEITPAGVLDELHSRENRAQMAVSRGTIIPSQDVDDDDLW